MTAAELERLRARVDKIMEQREIAAEWRHQMRERMYGDGTKPKLHTLREIVGHYMWFYETQIAAARALGLYTEGVLSGYYTGRNTNPEMPTRAKLFIVQTTSRNLWKFMPDVVLPQSKHEKYWCGPETDKVIAQYNAAMAPPPPPPPPKEPGPWHDSLKDIVHAMNVQHGSQAKAAVAHKVDKTYWSRLTRGAKDWPSDDTLANMGLERRVQYRTKGTP